MHWFPEPWKVPATLLVKYLREPAFCDTCKAFKFCGIWGNGRTHWICDIWTPPWFWEIWDSCTPLMFCDKTIWHGSWESITSSWDIRIPPTDMRICCCSTGNKFVATPPQTLPDGCCYMSQNQFTPKQTTHKRKFILTLQFTCKFWRGAPFMKLCCGYKICPPGSRPFWTPTSCCNSPPFPRSWPCIPWNHKPQQTLYSVHTPQCCQIYNRIGWG